MTEIVEHPLARRVRTFGARLRAALTARERTLVWLCIIAFVGAVTAVGAWKLWSFGYNGLDLAIYRQVAASSIHGQLFSFTIHPHSYLGDHLELFFAFLWPFYAVIQSPLTLIVLQAVALAIAVLPLRRIAERYLEKPWTLLVVLFYLGNPVVQNMALFEFHLLPFAIPLLSWTILAYLEQRFLRYSLLLLLALTVREDVALVVAGFGILAAIERRPRRWIILPILLGLGWLMASLKLTSIFSGYAQYKFLAYYRWLGDTPQVMLQTALTKPWIPLAHLLAPANLAFLLAVFLPFSYLPLASWRWLIPIIPTFTQLLLVQSPGGVLLSIHYPALLIPFLVVGAIAALPRIFHPPSRGPFRVLGRERFMSLTIVTVVAVYSTLVIGPFAQAVPVIAGTSKVAATARLENDVLATVPTDGGVIASFETLTSLSNRGRLYSAHYVFLGKKQFSDERYVVPNDTTTVVLDLRDFLSYQLLYKFHEGNDIRDGYRRIRVLLNERGFQPVLYIDRFLVWRRDSTPPVAPLYVVNPSAVRAAPVTTQGNLRLHDVAVGELTTQTVNGHTYRLIPLTITASIAQREEAIHQVEVQFRSNGQERFRELIPLGAGLFPTTDWQPNELVMSRYALLAPTWLTGNVALSIRFMALDGEIGLNGVRSLQRQYSRYQPLGPAIEAGQVELGTTR